MAVMDISTAATLLALGRVAIGLAPIVAPRLTAALIGFPTSHDNPTSRLMGRLFGVRDIGLGVLVLAALHGHASLRFALLFNAAHDLGDAVAIAVPLLRRQGIDRAALISLALATLGGVSWLVLWAVAGAQS